MALLTARELGVELNLRAKQVRRLALQGRIPSLRFGAEWRFDLDAVRQAATYIDPIVTDARQAARRAWMRPARRKA